jgi:hypothetical protein
MLEKYKENFEDSIKYSGKDYFYDDMGKITCAEKSTYFLIMEAAKNYFTEQFFLEIGAVSGTGSPVLTFGTQCANVHGTLIKYLMRIFPGVSFHLTLGGVEAGEVGFPYTKDDFIYDLKQRPNKVRGHVWITCGGEYVIDLTLGTYIENATNKSDKYGSIIYGFPGHLEASDFPRMPNAVVPTDLIYQPVAVGSDAILAVSPTFKEWKGG